LKKWPIFLAGAAIVIVGCGGGGGKGTLGATTTAVATAGDSIATVNLPTSVGLLYVYYLTGQGRALGDVSANFASAALKGPGVPTSMLDTGLTDPLPKPINAQLNQYSMNAQIIDQVGIVNSAYFNTFDFNIRSLQVQDSNGNLGSEITGPNGTYFLNPTNGAQTVIAGTGGEFSANIGIFPGRQTTVQIFVNDASIFNGANGYQFDRNIFLGNNTVAGNPDIQGFLSDYVMFDITHVASPPNVHTDNVGGTVPATRVYLGGEDAHYGASTSTYGGPFCVFTPNNVAQIGTFRGPDTLPPPPTGLSIPPITQGGTYTLRDPDPRDITGGSLITSLQGIWRPVDSVISNLGTFEVITMPHTGDDNNQDMVVIVRDANHNITNMYFGLVDLTGLTFTVYPIANIETGAVSGAITGTVSRLVDGTGAATSVPANVRFGRYSFSGTLPTGFKTTGKFLVFRV